MLTRGRIGALVVPPGIALGIFASSSQVTPLVLAVGVFFAAVMFLETTRLTMRRDVPWWVVHVAVIPWFAIVVLPWALFELSGDWVLFRSRIDTALPFTASFHVIALAGLTLGSFAALLLRGSTESAFPLNVNWAKMVRYIGLLLAVGVVSLVVARRPISSLWRLSGAIRYFDDPSAATSVQILDYAPYVAAAALLVGTAARRRLKAKPDKRELIALAVLVVLALGSGQRGRLYFVALGWPLIQFGPNIGARSTGARRLALALGAVCLLLVSVSGARIIGGLRSRTAVADSVTQSVAKDLDVIGSGELLFVRGATPGMLGGQSYRELPALLLPRRIVGESKPTPAADNLVRQLLDPNAGSSAPLWIEAALNFRSMGVLVCTVTYGFAAVWFLRKALRTRQRAVTAFGSLGPVWLLVSYLILSRLTVFQCGLTIGTVALGGILGSRAVTWRMTAGGSGESVAGPRRHSLVSVKR